MAPSPLSRAVRGFTTRKAHFDARIELHEIVNVPLVHGSFRVKWRVQHDLSSSIDTDTTTSASLKQSLAHAPRVPSMLLHRDEGRQTSRSPVMDDPYQDGVARGSSGTPPNDGGFGRRRSLAEAAGATPQRGRRLSHEGRNRDRASSPPAGLMSPVSEPDSPAPDSRQHGSRSKHEPKGITPWKAVNNHVVKLRRVVHCGVAVPLIKLGKDDVALQPSTVRFSVYQDLPSGPDGERVEGKMGEVEVDLTPFARHPHERDRGRPGEVVKSARFLLDNCVNNALLRVSIQLTWTGGESHFRLPSEDGNARSGASLYKGSNSSSHSVGSRQQDSRPSDSPPDSSASSSRSYNSQFGKLQLSNKSQQDREEAERLVDFLFDTPSELADAGRVEAVAKRISQSPERMATAEPTSSPSAGSGSGGSGSRPGSAHRGGIPLLPADVLARPRRQGSGPRPKTSGSIGSMSSLDRSAFQTANGSPTSPRITFVDTDRAATVKA